MNKLSSLRFNVLRRLDEYYEHDVINNGIKEIARDINETEIRVRMALRALKRKGFAKVITLAGREEYLFAGSNYFITEDGHKILMLNQ